VTGWRGVYAILEKVKELGLDKCDAGMSVGDVPAIVNIKTLKGRSISILGGWWGCGEECRKEKSVAGQFAAKYRSETYCWTQNQTGKMVLML
jgi:hypothetical protein